jgi:hypothetical protein
MDEIRDQMANVNDISEAISQPIGMASEFDEVIIIKLRSLHLLTINFRMN